MNYYVSAVMKVLQDGILDASDKYSFDVPPINSQEEWEKLATKALSEAEQFAALIEQLPENKLGEVFVEEKYGTYHRNLLGIIEHTHYHLGQVVLLKKLVA
jgi:hypothetical protein